MAKPLRDLIPRVVNQAASRSQPLRALQARWPAIVGPELARHSKPVNLRRHTLIVQSDQPGVSYTLSLLAPRLLAKISKAAPGRVEAIVIRPGSAA